VLSLSFWRFVLFLFFQGVQGFPSVSWFQFEDEFWRRANVAASLSDLLAKLGLGWDSAL
jgi:hypothetical protein